MGLDVSLIQFENFENAKVREAAYEERSEAIWEKHESHPEVARKKCKTLMKELNLGKWGDAGKRINTNSKKYPDHLFKVGYFRSSYNASGFNQVTEQRGLSTLYDIFPEAGLEERYIQPNWKDAKKRVHEGIAKFEEFLKTERAKYSVEFVSGIDKVKSEKDAMEVFLRMKKEKHFSGSFSSREGEFHLNKPLKVYGFVPGNRRFPFGDGMFVIYQQTQETLLWYLQALEVVEETIDFVLNAKNRTFAFSWSG